MLTLLLLLAVPAAAETVDIVRDAYGTPHIFAATAAGAAFGAGYAQAEDRPEALLQNLSLGEEGLNKETPALSPEVQTIVDAYVAGVNRALGAERITAAQVVAFSRKAYTWIDGSQDFILPPTRTTSKALTAVLDPIADWNTPDRPYEMSLYASSGDLSIAGVAPAGMPFPVVGHSQFVAIGWSGDKNPAGSRAIEEAWALITARDMDEVRLALAMAEIPGSPSCGTVGGETCARPAELNPVTKERLRVQNTWSLSGVELLAFSTEVYQAETWQRLLSRYDPNARLVKILTAWNRRADADSRGALAFYLFKRELSRDAGAVTPPDSLSKARVLSAITRALDRLELDYEFNANWGSVFRITRDGARNSFPASGGVIPEAGIESPRALRYRNNRAISGQAATRIVELSRTPTAVSVLLPGVTDDPASPYFNDQAGMARAKPTFFRDRRGLERVAVSRKQLTF